MRFPIVARGLWLASLGHLTIELCMNFLPVLYPLVMSSMGLNYTQVGIIALVAATSMSLAQPLFGWVSDRWGADRLGAASIVWIGCVMGLVGLAPNFPLLLLLIGLGGLGSAAFHPASAVIAAANSGSQRGSGLSIFSVGGNIGSALSPLWLGFIFTALGLVGTLTLIPLGIIAGAAFYWEMRRIRLAESTAPEQKASTAAQGFLLGLILVVVAMMFRSWFQVALITYLPILIEQGGGTVVLGGSVLSVFLFAISIGSLVGGASGDRFGHWQVILAGALIMTPALWVMLNGAGWMQIPALIVMGIAVGSTFPTSIVLALEAWPHRVGLASGLLMGLGWWPGGIGASFTGFLADRFSLEFALSALTLIPLITAVCMILYAVAARRRPDLEPAVDLH